MPKYDLAVVGAGLGGLAAAALSAKQNKKTIVLEPGDSVGGVFGLYVKKGFVFSPGPNLSFGFERGGAIQKLNERLGIAQNESLFSPCYQVALPDRRITIYAEQGETLDELRREFPREIDTIAKFYRDLRKAAERNAKNRLWAYLSRRINAGGFIHRYRFSREFVAFLEVQSYFFFNQRTIDISLISLISLFDSAPFTVQGGFGKLAEQMVDVLLKNRGEIKYQISFSQIAIRDGHPVILSIPQGSVEADAVLLNTEQSRRGELLYIGVRDEVVPVSMIQEVLCVSDYSHPERYFSLRLSAKDDESAAPRGMRALVASFSSLAPPQTGDACMRQIGALIPFLDEFTVFAESYSPAQRAFPATESVVFKTLRTPDKQMLLNRSSRRNVFMLSDGSGTPAQTIVAAQTLVERLR